MARRTSAAGVKGAGGAVAMRPWTVLAQDPTVTRKGGRALTTKVYVPAERMAAGPQGHRVHVIDYDSSTDRYYAPRRKDLTRDHYAKVEDLERLVGDPWFHAQHTYAVAMSTLTQFEKALGRQVPWGFLRGHQLKLAPHAFAEPNAYYSRAAEGLAFGYFPARRGRQVIFTCLSHDIVAHETTHALLDGLRSGYLRPSSPDQAGFHEGFADIVALLSVLTSAELVDLLIDNSTRRGESGLIPSAAVTAEKLRKSALATLAEQMGEELSAVRGRALRASATLKPSKTYLGKDDYQEPHRRGEVLVAAVIATFLEVWGARLGPLGRDRGLDMNRALVAEEGATAAQQLLTIAIRALDYAPPIDLSFTDFLRALLTADSELYPDDRKYEYRRHLRTWFADYGIESSGGDSGLWQPPPVEMHYEGLHFEPMQRDPDAVYRFVWENQRRLAIEPQAYTRVMSVRPCVRVSNDQFVLRETVAEYVQTLQVRASELRRWKIRKPAEMPESQAITLYGGGTLIFDEFGHLKYHIGKGVRSQRQSERLESLWARGYFQGSETEQANFAQLHRNRSLRRLIRPQEQW